MTDTFKDGIEAAARLVKDQVDEHSSEFHRSVFGSLARAILKLEPPQSTAVAIDPIAESFEQFKRAFISAGGTRNPTTPQRGWKKTEEAFRRQITKNRHDPQAIVTGTQAFAAYCRKRIAADPSSSEWIPGPVPFLNGEKFMHPWDRAAPSQARGNQRGAVSMFDVEEQLGDSHG